MLEPSGVFHYRDGALFCEETAVADIAARAGTPCYVYSRRAILERFRDYDEGLGDLPHRICYSVKANSNVHVLSLLARAGAGFDIVSGGELFRVLKAGGDPSGVVFSGVGKTAEEVEYALDAGIFAFNCESEAELALVDDLAARRGVKACVSLRVNPNVDAGAHPYISTGLREHKFGIDITEVEGVYERAQAFRHLATEGVGCHIGSQILEPTPLLEAADRMLELAHRLRKKGIPIRHLDLGGGLGVRYRPEDRAPDIRQFAAEIRRRMEGQGLLVLLEPGRSIVGEAGVLLTRVLYRKRTQSREFVVVDAAMNDLLRPSLYRSHHEILPVRRAARGRIRADVVGPVCESGDFLALDRELDDVLPGDLLAVWTAGAYGFVLASNYNSRPRPPEILVDGSQWRIIRARETYPDLVRGECP
ncbi:MAG: diaminopimelate decarboxylase [Bryobacterales bacterium]|nr:diaminopimelate decarboxylase [Bryobacteraceae bacterium]MDW8353314.1 diaminopimelate decarboxylase [Bryobacterales bacterium]